jgi:hypothetical protein
MPCEPNALRTAWAKRSDPACSCASARLIFFSSGLAGLKQSKTSANALRASARAFGETGWGAMTSSVSGCPI